MKNTMEYSSHGGTERTIMVRVQDVPRPGLLWLVQPKGDHCVQERHDLRHTPRE